MWALRALPHMRAIFRAIFKTDALLTSFDGCGVFRGEEHKFDANRSWLHVDQNLRLRPKLGTSIQGALNLVDAINPADSGSFLCIPKSHRVMQERVTKGLETALFKSKEQYRPLPLDHDLYVQSSDSKTSQVVAIGARAGDLVLWDSGLVHANYAPVSKSVTGRLRRLVGYCAMSEVDRMTEDEYKAFTEARVKAVAAAVTTSHWPTATNDNRMIYPRCAKFVPLAAPASCHKTVLSGAEKALVLGQAP